MSPLRSTSLFVSPSPSLSLHLSFIPRFHFYWRSQIVCDRANAWGIWNVASYSEKYFPIILLRVAAAADGVLPPLLLVVVVLLFYGSLRQCLIRNCRYVDWWKWRCRGMCLMRHSTQHFKIVIEFQRTKKNKKMTSNKWKLYLRCAHRAHMQSVDARYCRRPSPLFTLQMQFCNSVFASANDNYAHWSRSNVGLTLSALLLLSRTVWIDFRNYFR